MQNRIEKSFKRPTNRFSEERRMYLIGQLRKTLRRSPPKLAIPDRVRWRQVGEDPMWSNQKQSQGEAEDYSKTTRVGIAMEMNSMQLGWCFRVWKGK